MTELALIRETLGFLDDWEDRYRFIIDLGDSITPLATDHCIEENLIKGCQSLAWLIVDYDSETNRLRFQMYSDASIVRGLIAIVLAAYQDKSPWEVLDFDIEALFAELDLLAHLSMARGNGLRSMVATIQHRAKRIAVSPEGLRLA